MRRKNGENFSHLVQNLVKLRGKSLDLPLKNIFESKFSIKLSILNPNQIFINFLKGIN